MESDRSIKDFIKEMLIAFIGGGSLGLVVLIIVLTLVEHFKGCPVTHPHVTVLWNKSFCFVWMPDARRN